MTKEARSMTEPEAREAINQVFQPFTRLLNLERYDFHISLGRTNNPNWKASCNRNGEAHGYIEIVLDHDLHTDAADLHTSLFHELLHVALSPFDLYREVVSVSPISDHAEGAAWTDAVERSIRNLEVGIARPEFIAALLTLQAESDDDK